MKKLNLQKFIKEFENLKIDLYWEFWWWLDAKTTLMYKWLIQKEKDRPKLD